MSYTKRLQKAIWVGYEDEQGKWHPGWAYTPFLDFIYKLHMNRLTGNRVVVPSILFVISSPILLALTAISFTISALVSLFSLSVTGLMDCCTPSHDPDAAPSYSYQPNSGQQGMYMTLAYEPYIPLNPATNPFATGAYNNEPPSYATATAGRNPSAPGTGPDEPPSYAIATAGRKPSAPGAGW